MSHESARVTSCHWPLCHNSEPHCYRLSRDSAANQGQHIALGNYPRAWGLPEAFKSSGSFRSLWSLHPWRSRVNGSACVKVALPEPAALMQA